MSSFSVESGYVIADGLDVVILNNDEVLVQFGSRSLPAELFRDPDRNGILGSLVSNFLVGPSTLSDAVDGLDEYLRRQAGQVLGELVHKGILVKQSASPVEQYLAYTHTGETSLKERSVGVFGGGPLGERIAVGLRDHGVGKVSVVDDRLTDRESQRVANGDSAHNRLRSTAKLATAGIDVLHASELSPRVLEPIINAHDLMLVAFEQPSLSVYHLVNRICLKNSKPWMVATIDGDRGIAGPLFAGHETGCYNCYEALSESAIGSRNIAKHHRRHRLSRGSGSFSTGLPVHADIVAGFATLAALHFLLEKVSFLQGRHLSINFDRLSVDIEDVLRLPRCPVCQGSRPLSAPPFPIDTARAE